MSSVTEAEIADLCNGLLAELDPRSTSAEEFLGAQFDRGLAWVHFPVGEGGLAASRSLQPQVDQRLGAAGAPYAMLRNVIGHGMAAPTLVTHGTSEQKRRHLRPMFTGEDVWCQLFSEPGAGSDVAGLSTRAVRDGESWMVNGQKVWTSFAHLARWGLLVARTHPDVPKHKGLTYFIVDMHAHGVDVRPLVQLTRDAEFNEVYFTDAIIPDDQRVGDVGDGWRIALTTLMNERVAIGGQVPLRGAGPIAVAVDAWRSQPDHARAANRDELMRLWVEAEVLRLNNIRAAQLRARGTPGPEGSIGKILSSESNKRVTSFTVGALGASGMLHPDGYPAIPSPTAPANPSPQHAFLRARANSIEGGTTEIAKNIVAERVLALPSDVRVDKDLPWRDVPRSA